MSETDVEVIDRKGSKLKRKSKLYPPPSNVSTDETDVDADGANKTEGGIIFNPGKTSRWHRPKRNPGITKKIVQFILSLFQSMLIFDCQFKYNSDENKIRKSRRIQDLKKKALEEKAKVIINIINLSVLHISTMHVRSSVHLRVMHEMLLSNLPPDYTFTSDCCHKSLYLFCVNLPSNFITNS